MLIQRNSYSLKTKNLACEEKMSVTTAIYIRRHTKYIDRQLGHMHQRPMIQILGVGRSHAPTLGDVCTSIPH